MPPISKLPLRELMRRREDVVRHLEELAPELMQELRLLDTLIGKYDAGEKPYAQIKWPKTAIPLCLERNHAWMTREQIRRDLEDGGFVFDPEAFSGLLSDALRYHTRTGVIIHRTADGAILKPGDKAKAYTRDDYFGLPGWGKNVPIHGD